MTKKIQERRESHSIRVDREVYDALHTIIRRLEKERGRRVPFGDAVKELLKNNHKED